MFQIFGDLDIWMFSLSLSLHTNFLFSFFHFHFLSDCRKLYGRATGHLSITICPSLCPPPISAYSLYKETNPESLFVEKVIKCAITIYLGLEKAKRAIFVKDFFHISVLLAIEQQSIECTEIFWAAGGGQSLKKVHHLSIPMSTTSAHHSPTTQPLSNPSSKSLG